MSRTNHCYICEDCTADGLCESHRSPYSSYRHKPARFIAGRRGWVRKDRYPVPTYKRWVGPPTRWWWADQHAKVRRMHDAILRQAMVRDELDEIQLPPERRVIDLWDWD